MNRNYRSNRVTHNGLVTFPYNRNTMSHLSDLKNKTEPKQKALARRWYSAVLVSHVPDLSMAGVTDQEKGTTLISQSQAQWRGRMKVRLGTVWAEGPRD